MSENTIKKHIGEVFTRLNISNRTEFARQFPRLATVDPEHRGISYVGDCRIVRTVRAVQRQVPTKYCVHDENVVWSYISVANTHWLGAALTPYCAGSVVIAKLPDTTSSCSPSAELRNEPSKLTRVMSKMLGSSPRTLWLRDICRSKRGVTVIILLPVAASAVIVAFSLRPSAGLRSIVTACWPPSENVVVWVAERHVLHPHGVALVGRVERRAGRKHIARRIAVVARHVPGGLAEVDAEVRLGSNAVEHDRGDVRRSRREPHGAIAVEADALVGPVDRHGAIDRQRRRAAGVAEDLDRAGDLAAELCVRSLLAEQRCERDHRVGRVVEIDGHPELVVAKQDAEWLVVVRVNLDPEVEAIVLLDADAQLGLRDVLHALEVGGFSRYRRSAGTL